MNTIFLSLKFVILALIAFSKCDDSGSGEDVAESHNMNLNMESYSESDLRRDIFSNYSKSNIPVRNNTDTIDLLYGISIEGLVYFDQKGETIKINTLTTLIWEDHYLKWDDDERHSNHAHNPDFIVVPNNMIWQPDLELYNSGSKPEVFDRAGVSKLYSNGVIIYNRPTSYTFSCKLSLEDFPFDKQVCSMTFGSWKYPKAILNLRPFKLSELRSAFLDSDMDINAHSNTTGPHMATSMPHMATSMPTMATSMPHIATTMSMNMTMPHHTHSSHIYTPVFLDDLRNIKNISVSPFFSHNEWIIDEVKVEHQDFEYLCCPGDLWPNTVFSITLKRNPNKYIVLMIMAVFITLSSLVVNILHLTQYRRTYILVFIPLTLIWLQIHSSSKIPVIEYPTKLEKIIQLCFYVTIISAFESGIIYNLVLNRFNRLSVKFKESTFKKMETMGLFESILVYKTPDSETDNDNKFFQGYIRSIIMFDNVFRVLLTFIFFIVLACLI